jgi:hypothetical protein
MEKYCPINCKWLNVTEEEQNRILINSGKDIHHVCLKYERDLHHLSDHPKLHKCDECCTESDNKTCPHCHPPYDHFGKYYIVGDYPNDPGLHVLRRDDALGGVSIDYCPICGRKLEE